MTKNETSVNSSGTVKKKKKKMSPVVIIILIVAIGIFIFAGYNLSKILLRYKEASDSYKSVESIFDSNPGSESQNNAAAAALSAEESEADRDYVPFVWDFTRLKVANPDAVGWIYEKDLLSYPIVQGPDNDYYLHRLFDGTPSFAGSLFVDAQLKDGLAGQYSIVYGHNMNDGSMFGVLHKFHQDPEFYKKHPTMHVFIGEKHYIYNVLAAYRSHVQDFTYVDPLNNADVSEFAEKARTMSVSEMYPGKITDKTNMLVLSTCTEASDNDYRFVVVLSRDHEVKYQKDQ